MKFIVDKLPQVGSECPFFVAPLAGCQINQGSCRRFPAKDKQKAGCPHLKTLKIPAKA